jgi:hypothetical protein
MRGSAGFLPVPSARVSPVLIHRRGSSSEAWKAKARCLERAQAWMPERTPGGAALGSPEPTTMRVLARPPRCCRLRVGSCLVARLFRRRLLWRRWHRHGGEKLERSSSIRRPLRLVGCFGSAAVSSLDFFAAGCCGGVGIDTVAKNSNAPRAPADPIAWLVASGRQLSRRSTFSPQAAVVALASTRWRKTRTLLEHPPTPSPGWLLRGGSCLVARLFRRRLLWRRWHRHGGEKLERSSSTRRPLRLLGGQAWCSSLLAARRLAQRVSLRSSVERSIPRMLAALVLLPLAASMVARM